MEFRSIFRPPPGASIPLLPLHTLRTHTTSTSFPNPSPPRSPYHTAPQSPNLPPPGPPHRKVSFADPPLPTMTSPSPSPHPYIPQSDTQIALRRHQSHMESHLQTLLDAQSEGLLAELARGAPSPALHDDGSSSTAGRSTSRSTTGTATPTSQTRSSRITWAPPGGEEGGGGGGGGGGRKRQVMPVRQPKPKRIGLRSARRGISRTMAELAVLKTQEAEALAVELDRRADAVAAVSGVADKQAGLRAQIQTIEHEPASEERLQAMKSEEAQLDAEIHAIEGRLDEMKARQRVLRREIGAVENGVQAKLSSYRNALGLAEKEARSLVARPLLEVERGPRVRTGLWALPKERRTLEMVREHYEEGKEVMRGHIQGLGREREALEEGGEVWAEIVKTVMGVEEALRMEMKTAPEETREVGMKRILERMSQAIARMEEELVEADEKGWNLLVAAIGAEAAALREGYRVLEGALREAVGDGQSENLPGHMLGEGRDDGKEQTGVHGLEELEPGMGPEATGSMVDRSEEEDDGPGPELLIEDHEDD